MHNLKVFPLVLPVDCNRWLHNSTHAPFRPENSSCQGLKIAFLSRSVIYYLRFVLKASGSLVPVPSRSLLSPCASTPGACTISPAVFSRLQDMANILLAQSNNAEIPVVGPLVSPLY